jgi:uncharacterized coiled-coil DUF342 family protein
MELGTSSVEGLRRQIFLLGKELEALNNSKESLYKEKANLDSCLAKAIIEANKFREEKRAIDEEIKAKKQLRTKLNQELKAYSAKLKTLKKNLKKNPKALRQKIEAMQYAIETEGLSFEKEKIYMDKIKSIKEELALLAPIEAELKEYTSKKELADQIHKEIQNLASKSTKCFELLTFTAKSISEIKSSRAEIQKKLKELKTQIELKNQLLADALSQWLDLTKTTAPEISLKNIELELINKFKNSKRLTKDDILKLQRLATDNLQP